MAQEKVSMRKIKEILRLRYDLGLRQDQIARSCNIGQSTVHRYLERFAAAEVSWPLPAECDEARLERLLFATRRGRPAGRESRPGPDFVALHSQLQKHKHLTLQLLWEEYRAEEPEGYGYSRFCELYGAWKDTQDVVLRQEHRAGEKLFVDWAGVKIPIYHREVGEIDSVSLFVAVMGASSYTFVHATRNQDLRSWIDCHVRAFEFIEGVPKLVIPDNPRTGVDRACRYEPDLNRTYRASSEWVRQHQNLLLIGPTGIGKTWLGCALAQKACRDGFTILHKRSAEMFRDLAVAHVDGSFDRQLTKLSRIDILVLDDFAMAPLKDGERRDFLELCDDRYQRRSMIPTSQLPLAHWHEQIGDPTLADSILDRLVHNAYRIELNGESMRKKRGRKLEEET